MSSRRWSLSSPATFLTSVAPIDHKEVDSHPELEREIAQQEHRHSCLASTGTQGLPDALKAFLQSSVLATVRRQSMLSQLSYQSLKQSDTENLIAGRTKLEMIQYKKMKRAISYESPPDYYDKLPVKPGVMFFKALLPEGGSDELKVDFRIPKTAIVYEKIYFAEWMAAEQATVITDLFKIHEFYNDFKRDASSPSDLVAVRRTDLRCGVLSLGDLYEHIYKSPLPSVGLYQERIKPKHEDRPALLRVFMVNSTRSGKASCAFVIANTHTSPSLNSICRYIIRTDLPGSFTVYRQSGISLRKAIAASAQVITHLQRRYYIRIEEIVLDFIEDTEGHLWLIACKGYRVEDVQVQREIRREARVEQVRCRLCLLPVKTREIEHVLPFKMILLFKHHIARRGRSILPLSHIRANSQDYLSHWIRLCDLCHMLVQAEYQLLQAECELGSILNVPVTLPELLGQPTYEYPNYMPGKLPQWRLLLMFDSIEWVFKGKLPQVYLKFALFDGVFTYYRPITPDSKVETILSAARLFYYYSTLDPSALSQARDLTVSLRFTRSKSWNSSLLSASFTPLSLFSLLPALNSSCTDSNKIPVYNKEDEIVAWVRVVVGISCGKEATLRELETSIRRIGELYLPEEGFVTGDLIPEEWLEAVDSDYKTDFGKTIIRDEKEEMERCYSPLLTHRRIFSTPLKPPKPSPASKRLKRRAKPAPPVLHLKSRRASSTSSPYSLTTMATASSAQLLFSLDQRTHLKTPMFLPTRLMMTTANTPCDWTIAKDSEGEEDSSDLERVEQMIPATCQPIDTMASPLITETIDACLRSRHIHMTTQGPEKSKARNRPSTGRRKMSDPLTRVYSGL